VKTRPDCSLWGRNDCTRVWSACSNCTQNTALESVSLGLAPERTSIGCAGLSSSIAAAISAQSSVAVKTGTRMPAIRRTTNSLQARTFPTDGASTNYTGENRTERGSGVRSQSRSMIPNTAPAAPRSRVRWSASALPSRELSSGVPARRQLPANPGGSSEIPPVPAPRQSYSSR
jgi:hypothetical protein